MSSFLLDLLFYFFFNPHTTKRANQNKPIQGQRKTPNDTWIKENPFFWKRRNGSANSFSNKILSPPLRLHGFVFFYRKIHCLTSEFHVNFHAKNRYRTHRFAIRAISVFQVKFNVEFTRQAVNFSWIAWLQKGNSITGRKQTFCIFVSRAGQWTNDGNPFKVSCQDLANRKKDIFRLKTTFISS